MTHALRIIVWTSAALLAVAVNASAQSQVPPPTGPLTVCFTQPPPTADSYQLIFDGAAPETAVAAPITACPSGTTHALAVPAARFTVGTHTIVIRATNAFGVTESDPHTVVVGIRPGKPVVSGVVTPGA